MMNEPSNLLIYDIEMKCRRCGWLHEQEFQNFGMNEDRFIAEMASLGIRAYCDTCAKNTIHDSVAINEKL